MIEFVRGTVVTVNDQQVVLERDGLGWSLMVTRPEACLVGELVTLFAYLHWNQEQGPSLFGFFSAHERTVFTMVLSSPGVGPKLALAALSQLQVEGLVAALVQADVKALSSVSGIGTRKAETMIVALKDKAEKLLASGAVVGDVGEKARSLNEVARALEALGYERAEVRGALDYVRQVEGESLQVSFLIKKALTFLAKRPSV